MHIKVKGQLHISRTLLLIKHDLCNWSEMIIEIILNTAWYLTPAENINTLLSWIICLNFVNLVLFLRRLATNEIIFLYQQIVSWRQMIVRADLINAESDYLKL